MYVTTGIVKPHRRASFICSSAVAEIELRLAVP